MTDMELADLVENGRLRFYWVKRDGKARDVEEQIIAALRRGPEPSKASPRGVAEDILEHEYRKREGLLAPEHPLSGEMVTTFLVDGKEMKLCDCPPREAKCPRGVERRLLTTEFSRCLLPR